MMKRMLATSALASLLATGVMAQTATETAPATPAPVAPAQDGVQGGAAPEADGATPIPDIVEDDAATDPADPALAEDDAMTDPADPALAEEEAVTPPADPMLADDGAVGDPADPMAADAGWGPIDLATVSSEQLIGTDIVTYENETIASIEDVLITDDGQVESLVARFGGFLGFGADRVLLTIDEVEMMQDESETLVLRTNLTPESIESRPDYEG